MEKPNSITHYTSLEVVHILLNQALSKDDGEIVIHASLLTMMNDSGEGCYVLNKYFTDSTLKKEKKEKWEKEFYPNNQPFIFSTIATSIDSRHNGSLPMWKMYGNDCKGALIRFDTRKMKEFCDANGYIFAPCKYLNTNDVQKLIKEFNQGRVSFEEILTEACLSKHTSWSYESEWRVIRCSSQENILTKYTNRGIIEYIEISIPIELIEEICLGPLTNPNSFESLKQLKNKLSEKFKDKVHFNLTKSKITIQ